MLPNCAQSREMGPLEALSPASIEALGAADVVIIGEIHPNSEHHQNQAAFVSLVKPKALVFEMIDEGAGPAFSEGYHQSDRPAFLDRIEAGEFGWKSLAEYLTIVDAMPEAQIVGAAAPRAEVRRTVGEGAAVVFGDDAARYGLNTALPPEQLVARKDLQLQAHCNALPEAMLGGMVEAQRFRDAYFARKIVAAFATTGGPVVMITGNGHARNDWGVPAALTLAAPKLSVISIGQHEEADQSTEFDLALKTAPFDEGDPCADFKVK